MIGIFQVIHSLTLWKDKTDCMIKYIQYDYPKGCIYTFTDWGYHIWECWLENDYMIKIWEVDHCIVNTDDLHLNFNNTIYCHTALATKIIWNNL